MVGNVDAAGEPDLVMALHVIDEPGKGCGASWAANQTAVQADVHHFRSTGGSLGIEHVESVLQIAEELVAAVEPLSCGKTHVVGIERVGNDQLGLAVMFVPIGQVVGIAVGNIGKTAFLADEIDGVFRTAAGIPATGPLTGHQRVQADCLGDLLALIRRGPCPCARPISGRARRFPSRHSASPPPVPGSVSGRLRHHRR